MFRDNSSAGGILFRKEETIENFARVRACVRMRVLGRARGTEFGMIRICRRRRVPKIATEATWSGTVTCLGKVQNRAITLCDRPAALKLKAEPTFHFSRRRTRRERVSAELLINPVRRLITTPTTTTTNGTFDPAYSEIIMLLFSFFFFKFLRESV